jgi:hypothetical protein
MPCLAKGEARRVTGRPVGADVGADEPAVELSKVGPRGGGGGVEVGEEMVVLGARLV